VDRSSRSKQNGTSRVKNVVGGGGIGTQHWRENILGAAVFFRKDFCKGSRKLPIEESRSKFNGMKMLGREYWIFMAQVE
jgi:hypothetical protein